MVSVTIDGLESEVEPGTTILRAAAGLGIDIPVFCYHEGLSVAANCRMCLVEVEGVPKPVPACEVEVREGMVVRTTSPTALAARKATLEFLLVNHPVDCPICDQAGECRLQDHYFHHSGQPSRINVRKVRKAKALPIGETVMLDRERCINCTRCVRFTREVSGSNQLTQVNRGNRTEIALFPGRDFTDPYSLCTVDLCPVGALTSRDFRFRKRVWWLSASPSVCPECARNCALDVDHEQGTIYRLRPRYEPRINQWWACDAGRLAYHDYARDRVARAHVLHHRDGEAVLTPREGLVRGAEQLQDAAAEGARRAVIVSGQCTLEEAWAAGLLARDALGLKSLVLARRTPWSGDDLLRVPARDANARGVADVATALGLNLLSVEALLAASAGGLGFLAVGSDFVMPPIPADVPVRCAVVLSHRRDDISSRATCLVPVAAHYERGGHFRNVDAVQQGFAPVVPPPPGVPTPLAALLRLARALGRPLTELAPDDFASAALQSIAGEDSHG